MRAVRASLHLDSGRDFRGSQRQLLDLLRGLRRHGQRVLLCCPRSAPLFAAARGADVPVQPLTLRSASDFPSAVRLARLLGEGDFDLVHAHDAASHGIARAAQGINRHPALTQNLFVTCRRIATDLEAAERARSDAAGTHFVAVSRYLREALLRRGVDGSHVAVVPSGADLERMAPARRRDQPDAWGLSGRGLRVVGTVGHLSRHKNHLLLVEAFARLHRKHPETHLLLAGQGPMRKAVQKRVAQLQLEPHVTFAGYIEDVVPAYAALHLFVLTSDSEGSCTALLDALSAGVPVVACACEGVLDLARHGDTALVVPPRDPDILAESMGRLLQEADLAARLVEGGQRMARQRCSDSVIEAMLEVYAHLGRDEDASVRAS